jgi:hypothetical protein
VVALVAVRSSALKPKCAVARDFELLIMNSLQPKWAQLSACVCNYTASWAAHSRKADVCPRAERSNRHMQHLKLDGEEDAVLALRPPELRRHCLLNRGLSLHKYEGCRTKQKSA